MIKTYRANTNVSINVVLASKKNFHVTFNGLSNGSSTYTTDNEEVQAAIERHYKFGKLFKLASSRPNAGKVMPAKANAGKVEPTNSGEVGTACEAPGAAVDGTSREGEDTAGDSGEPAAPGLQLVTVSDIATAKDYLAEKFGISRTAMRSAKAIMEHAAAQGIEFVGL